MPKKRIAAGAGITFFAHQNVQSQTGQVVCNWIKAQLFFLVEDFAVGVAVVAGLGLDPFRAIFNGMVSHAFGALAVRAGHAYQMPFHAATRAAHVAATIFTTTDTYHAGYGQAAAGGAHAK